jgi:hypothetical protein
MLVAAGAVAYLFLGPTMAMCLGPLGVTAVQCAKATGIVPTAGAGLPVLTAAVAGAVLLVGGPPAGRRRASFAGAIAGGLIAGGAYVVLRPRTMEGLTSYGTWISIERPLDLAALAAAVILGALVLGLAAGWVGRRRTG